MKIGKKLADIHKVCNTKHDEQTHKNTTKSDTTQIEYVYIISNNPFYFKTL